MRQRLDWMDFFRSVPQPHGVGYLDHRRHGARVLRPRKAHLCRSSSTNVRERYPPRYANHFALAGQPITDKSPKNALHRSRRSGRKEPAPQHPSTAASERPTQRRASPLFPPFGVAPAINANHRAPTSEKNREPAKYRRPFRQSSPPRITWQRPRGGNRALLNKARYRLAIPPPKASTTIFRSQ